MQRLEEVCKGEIKENGGCERGRRRTLEKEKKRERKEDGRSGEKRMHSERELNEFWPS